MGVPASLQGSRFVPGLFVGIFFGLGFAYAFLATNNNATAVRQQLVSFFQPEQQQRPIPIRNSFLPASVSSVGAKSAKKKPVSHQLFSTYYDESSVPFTDLSGSKGKSGLEFWNSHKPSYKCPEGHLSRVGREQGDGGKWMCGLEAFGRLTARANYPCVFYSFGVSGDSSFEAEVMQTTTCSVWAYDMSVPKIGKPLKPSNPRVHFHPLGISGRDDPTTKTLKSLMTRNGHKFIDILKMDVEGSEYDSLKKALEDFPPGQLPIGQLMVELHSSSEAARIFSLVEQLEKRGLRVFSIEPNMVAVGCCSEFSFINLKYRKLFIPD